MGRRARGERTDRPDAGGADTAPSLHSSNSIGMEFIRIEPGTMQVGVFHPDCANGGGGRGRGGAPRDPRMIWDEADRAACEAQTKADRSDGYPVTLKKPYLIGKTEVTQAQWKAVMRRIPRCSRRTE